MDQHARGFELRASTVPPEATAAERRDPSGPPVVALVCTRRGRCQGEPVGTWIAVELHDLIAAADAHYAEVHAPSARPASRS